MEEVDNKTSIRSLAEQLLSEARNQEKDFKILSRQNRDLNSDNEKLKRLVERQQKKIDNLENRVASYQLSEKLNRTKKLKSGNADKKSYLKFVQEDEELFELLKMTIDVAIENGISSSIINRSRLSQKLYLNIVGDKNNKPSISKAKYKLFLQTLHKIGPDKLKNTQYMPKIRSADCLLDETQRFIDQLKSTGLIKSKTTTRVSF